MSSGMTSEYPETFRALGETLTHGFRGRRADLLNLLDRLRSPSGFIMLWGSPGIGKSTLVARLVQVLDQAEQAWPRALAELGTAPPRITTLAYFIRREQHTDAAETLLANLNQRIEDRYRTGIPMGETPREMALGMTRRLAAVSAGLGEDQRLLLCIEGLDQGAEAPDLLALLPKTLPERVLGLYCSRPHALVQDLVEDQLDPEQRQVIWLGEMERADMDALLADTPLGPALHPQDRESLLTRCAGNPLYLELVCRSLLAGEAAPAQILRLPRTMRDRYDAAWRPIGRIQGAHALLCLLAATHDPLTPALMSELLLCQRAELEGGWLPHCLPLLRKEQPTRPVVAVTPVTARQEGYRLFHASLRDYLWERFPEDIEHWSERLADWCLEWPGYSDTRLAYAVRHGVEHLAISQRQASARGDSRLAARRLEQLHRLIADPSWCDALIEVCGTIAPLRRGAAILRGARARDGSGLRGLLRYNRLLHDETARLHGRQLERIDAAGSSDKQDDLDRLPELARIGANPDERVLLVLRALWSSPRPRPIPAHVRQAVAAWLTRVTDPDLSDLWEETMTRSERG